MPKLADTIKTISTTVEYRTKLPGGTRVIRVSLATMTPRVLCFFEEKGEQRATSIFVDELEAVVEDALKRVEKSERS